ncbi:MAG: MG2 domain-containing protein [Gammaproteobacteria bacterium]|nr:MG2 domain-containing protein [Gammaproteobacteria bacterium]
MVSSVVRRIFLAAIMIGAGFVRAEARIETFSPTGYAKDVRQVAVRFSDAMVALGDPERSDPFAVDCEVPGNGRWIDQRNWVYDFDYDVPGAVRCVFVPRTDSRTLAGDAVQIQAEYAFHTGGPAILDSEPGHWGIDERQVFLLALDADPEPDSIREHAHCDIGNSEDIRSVEVVRGKERAEILAALEAAGSARVQTLVESASSHLPRTEEHETRRRALERIVMLRCRHPLPAGTTMRLIWGAGIAALNGRATMQDDALSFTVRRDFTANVQCLRSFKGRCVDEVGISFSSPVARELARSIRLVDQNGIVVEPQVEDDVAWIARIDFPEALADQTSYRAELVGPITDIDGRELANASSFPQTIRVGKLPPDASFGGFRVVPHGPDAVASVLLRRLEEPLAGRRLKVVGDSEIVAWMRRVEGVRHKPDDAWVGAASELSVFGTAESGVPFTLSPAGNAEQPYWLAGVPLPEGGFHVVELELPAARGLPRRYVTGLAVVTDLAVHFLRANESSLVWVTGLSDGRPVGSADIAISDACTGRVIARGETDAEGIARISGVLPWREACADFRYLVSARKNGDVGITTSGTRTDEKPRPTFVAHPIMDRTLYQPGDTVSMKLIVRHADAIGLVLPTGTAAKGVLSILHYPADESQADLDVDFAGDGTALASFELPASAKLGWYVVRLQIDGQDHWIGDFRVELFRVGATRGTIDGPKEPRVNTGSVPVTLSVQHLAGGAAASLPVAVRTTVRPTLYDWETRVPREPQTTSKTLDSNGKAQLEIPVGSFTRKSMLDVEMDYQDANGQRKTAHKAIELWPAAIQLAVGTDRSQPRLERILVTARGLDGRAVPGVAVEASIYHPRAYGYGRLPGGFRGRVRRSESALLTTCSGRTDATGSLGCSVPPQTPNSVFVEVRGWDEDGNATSTAGDVRHWPTAAHQRAWLNVDEERQFAVGETVPIALDLPFGEASVLVAVHREGVLDAFVERVGRARPVIDLSVQRYYAPSVKVTVLAVRPHAQPAHTARPVKPVREWQDYRVRETNGPAFYLGTVWVEVEEALNALSVHVEPERDTYGTRERARVRIAVAGPDGQPRPDAEVALVAVDEGLLDLKRNKTWDILKAMMANRYPTADTKTSMGSLFPTFRLSPSLGTVMVSGVGLQGPYVNTGQAEIMPLRERFDALLLWRARLAMGDDGTAEADIPLNDLLTSFRVVAVATAGDDLFGTGEATIRTTQDLIVHAGLPEIVREGDRFNAVFTVRNASRTARRVNVTPRAEGLPKLRPKRLRLRGGQAREVSWPVTVPAGVDGMHWEVMAKGRVAADRVAARQTVRPAVPVRVQQATLTQLAAPRELPVKAPHNALPDRGGIRVSLLPSLADNLGSVREAMARYRYSCVEQVVSAAVVLADEERWAAAMESARASLDDDGLLRFFPSAALQGSPVLTAYVLTIADAARKTVPDDFRESMVEGLEGYLAGRIVRASVFRAADSQLRRLTALAALARHGAVDREMLDKVEVNVEALPTSALLDWIDILLRVLPEDERLAVAKDALRVRLNLQGTTMGFSTEHTDQLWWLMVATDGNAARAILSVLDDPDWQVEVPRMVRGLFGRQIRGRWQTTVANAWGTVATGAFRTVFEAEPVTGASTVRLGEVRQQAIWPSPGDAAALPQSIELPWSAAQALALSHEGMGAPWGMVEFRAAVPLTEPAERGYRIVRRIDAVDRKDARRWSRGDAAQVVLDIDADADMTWVVVEDPVPPGAVVLGSGLGGDSSILSPTHVRGDSWPVFTERHFDSYRAYYRYVPKGRTILRYNVRYNTAGTFQLPPSRVEAMYAPEMHAELPVKPVTIR